jgi:hypothetical protein
MPHVVVAVGFRQRRYVFLESDGVAEVCVDRNGSIALPVNVTMVGSEFWYSVDAICMVKTESAI